MEKRFKLPILLVIILIFSAVVIADKVDIKGSIKDNEACDKAPLALSIWCPICLQKCDVNKHNPDYFIFTYDNLTMEHSCTCNFYGDLEEDLDECFKELLGDRIDKDVTDMRFDDSPLSNVYNQESVDRLNGEYNLNMPEWGKRLIVDPAYEDSDWGEFSRFLLPKIGDVFTYDEPETKSFFEKTDAVQGTQVEKIPILYEMVTDALPQYRYAGSKDMCYSFEEMLSNKRGICKEQTILLKTVLERHGIHAETATTNKHVWIRVRIDQKGSACDGKWIDLDPTWYKSFVPLEIRN
ncbi:MAG: transglutaminase domain-containing protein [Candidatus Woesearchaeota archaeon]